MLMAVMAFFRATSKLFRAAALALACSTLIFIAASSAVAAEGDDATLFAPRHEVSMAAVHKEADEAPTRRFMMMPPSIDTAAIKSIKPAEAAKILGKITLGVLVLLPILVKTPTLPRPLLEEADCSLSSSKTMESLLNLSASHRSRVLCVVLRISSRP